GGGGGVAGKSACGWPERVKKLWLAGAPGMWVEDEPLPDLFRVMQNRDAIRKLLFDEPQSPMAKMIIQDNPDPETMMGAYRAMTTLARLVWERPYDPKLPGRLHRVQCPTLLIWGENDRLVPPAYGKAYQKFLPQAEFKTIPGCGHLGMFEKEAEFVETVARFCED